jgi:hypothetical protein
VTKREIENIRVKMQDELNSLKEATEMWRAEAPGRDNIHPSHPELTAYLLHRLKMCDDGFNC